MIKWFWFINNHAFNHKFDLAIAKHNRNSRQDPVCLGNFKGCLWERFLKICVGQQ